MSNKTIIIGDVHGCLVELDALIKKLNLKGDERLIFVGDLINKGPDSLGVLKRVVDDLKAEVILGNHELGFIEHVKTGKFEGAFESVRSELGSEVEHWVTWMETLPTYIEEDEFMVVHGGLTPNTHPKDMDKNTITRIRTWDGQGKVLRRESDPPWYQLYKDKKLVVYGHWASQGLTIRKNTIGIDSGCCWGNKLSALILPTKEIVQVDAKKFYALDDSYKEHLKNTGRWPPKKILFLCTGNSCRSQMAEGLARQILPEEVGVYSAGIEKHGMNAYAIKVMGEIGIDLKDHYSKTLKELKDQQFETIYTVCGHANE
ncbi:MAG: hypothetical protein HOM21_13675, partial [Halobacteriovoraceae bacterium]|nr:hypothetical protein [Halobacteriovoraceae bacterium]